MFDKKFLEKLRNRKKEWENTTLSSSLEKPGERKKGDFNDKAILTQPVQG